MVASTATTYTTDANGNVRIRETQPSSELLDFKYDVLNQLKGVTRGPPGPSTVTGLYDYDAAGRRIRQDQTDRGQVDSTYDGISVLEEAIRSLPAGAAQAIHYHYDGSSLLAQSAAGTNEYFHQDRLGSTANRSDVLASPTGDYKYDPFGGIRSQPEPKSGAAFTGQQYDQSTGLYYYGARFYDPALGRFLTEDTYAGQGAQPQSLQKYLYAYSNPAKYTDPTGHSPDGFPSDFGPADVAPGKPADGTWTWVKNDRGDIRYSYESPRGENGGGYRYDERIDWAPPPLMFDVHAESPRHVRPGYVITGEDLQRWYGAGSHPRTTVEDNSARTLSLPAPTPPKARPGFWATAWAGVTGGGIGPSSAFGQMVSHGDYGFSLFGHEFRPSSVLQDDVALERAQNTVIALTAGAEVALATGGLAAIWGSGTFWGGTYGTAIAGGVVGGVETRATEVWLNGGDLSQQAAAAFDPNAMATDALFSGALVGAGEVLPGAFRQVRGWFGGGRPPSLAPPTAGPPGSMAAEGRIVDEYRVLARRTDIPGQAHHLNQDAAYGKVIPRERGVSTMLEGNAFTEVGSPHYEAHASLEQFWNQFRRGGARFGQRPTNTEYSGALGRSLRNAGLPEAEVQQAVRAAVRQRLDYGLLGGENVPRVPGRINQRR